MFLAFVLAGLAAGGMSTLSSFRGAYAAFLVPAILPFAIKIMLQEGEVFVAMSSMMILFIAMMSLISARHYKSVTESLRLRFDNEELSARSGCGARPPAGDQPRAGRADAGAAAH